MEEVESLCETEEPHPSDSTERTSMETSEKNASDTTTAKSGVKRVRRPTTKNRPSTVDNGFTLKTYLPDSSTVQFFRTHRCPKCDRCFKMRSHLQEHMNLHFPDPNLQCSTCKQHFTSKSKLRLHQLREAGLKPHQCHLCQYSAVERNSLLRHLLTVHGEKDRESTGLNFVCPVCAESFYQSRSLKNHMKTHNVVKSTALLSCVEDSCSYKSTLFLVLKHISEEHDFSPVECQHHNCMAIFKTEELMKEHYKTHQAYHCADCDFSCSNKRLFTQHRRQGHSGGEQFSCEFCDFKTFNSVEFERHVEHLHASEKIHKCPQCNYCTAHKRGLKRHLLTHSGEKPYKCSECEFRCRDEWYLSRHSLTHSDHKNHMCSECGYVTKWKHYLTVHMRKHMGDLRYHCDQCSYRCHRADQLSSHKLRHQEKSLICEVCAYSCKRKYELRQHMLSKHSDTDQPAAVFKCTYCSYSTSFRQALHNHENCKHTKTKEFRCALCSYTSFSSVSLFLHKRKTHGYVPGDKVWLQDYALKEKEKSTFENVGDFYTRSNEEVTSKQHSYVDASKTSVASNSKTVLQGVTNKDTFTSSNEDYCTLVLTTLTSNEEETSTLQENTNILMDGSKKSESLFKVVGQSPTLSSEAEEDASFDDDETGLCEKAQTREETYFKKKNESGSSALQSSIVVKNLKELDKIQSASMVLEGHVEMVMVPTTKAKSIVKSKTHKSSSLQERKFGLRKLDIHRKTKCLSLESTNSNMKSSDQSSCLDLPIHQKTLSLRNPQTIDPDDSNSFLNSIKVRIGQLSKDNKANSALPSFVELNGKFQCKECGFSSARAATIDRHTTTCRNKSSNKAEDTSQEKTFRRKAVTIKMWSCSQCNFTANSTSSLIRHKALTHKKNNFSCEFCPFICKQERRLLQHVAVKHKNKNPFQCRFCKFSTKRKYRMEEHESVHTGVGRHGCDVCDKTFGALSKLRKHKSRLHDKTATHFCTDCDFSSFSKDDVRRHSFRCHSGDLNFDCELCGAKFSSQIALGKHCKRAHETSLTCKVCGYTCSSVGELNGHQTSKHRSDKEATIKARVASKDLQGDTRAQHACPLCQFNAKTKSLLAQHLSSKHEDGLDAAKSLICSQCEFRCRHQLVLEQHLRSHGGRRLYKCTQCEFSSVNKQKMTWHIRTHTGDKPYSCDRCNYTCTEPSRLKQHMRVHQEERKFLCPECGYKCKWATQLKLHMTKHTGEKHFACPDCDYRCSRADALRSHRSTQHSSSRPFVCEHCGKAFKTAFVLKTHQQQHSDARPYVCGLCQKTFKWPAGLRHHFLSHTKQRPFRCRVCSYQAKQRFQVVKHLKKHHPEVSAEEGVERDAAAGGLTIKEALEGAVEKGEPNKAHTTPKDTAEKNCA